MENPLHLPHGLADPTTWVLVALAAFLALVVFLRVPAMVTKILDARAKAIRDELDEAKRLREDAQELLASYQRRQREAEREAGAIIDQAKREAVRLAEEMRLELVDRLERRAEMAERKIAQAEAQASQRVRVEAAELAVEAARAIVADAVDAKSDRALFEESVSELEKRFS